MACSKSASEFSVEEFRTCAEIYKTNEEILHYLVSQSERVEETLNQNDMSAKVCFKFLGLLCKALKCDTKASSVLELLNIIRHSRLLRVHISNVLHSCGEQFKKEEICQLLWYIIDILNEMSSRMPNSLVETLGLILVIKKVAENERTSNEEDDNSELTDILKKTGFLRNSAFLELSKPTANKKLHSKHDYKPPPDNFREVPILPCKTDIFPTSDVYLRPIIAKGSYKDLEHYLDVQFRLYREDCISPLRDGIAEYVTQISGGQEVRRLQDVRLYKNVRIINKEITLEGVVYWIKLDPHHAKRIRWESSKRLLYGSLVCLSPDNFRSLLFAIVMESDRDELQSKGRIKVQFADIEINSYNVVDTSFTMVETTAYFESYRHVLTSLQKIQNGDLPFERYIVHCKKEVFPPSYLEDENTTYDLWPIHTRAKIAFTSGNVVNESLLRGLRQFRNRDFNFSSMKELKILSHVWPSADDLHLDESQFRAFRSALTKEFVLIQGPPGTGKTHVGLQIAKTLLHNRQKWVKGNISHQPMLVVCFTNHALDQFMEGIVGFLSDTGLSWKDHIVRVGGRCENKTIEELSLKNKRSRSADSRGLYRQLKDLQENIALLRWRLRMSKEVIFDEILKETVVEKKFHFLFEPFQHSDHKKGNQGSPCLFQWLGVTKSNWISRSQKIFHRLNTKRTNNTPAKTIPFETKDKKQGKSGDSAVQIPTQNIKVKTEAERVKDDRQIEMEEFLVKTEFDEKLGLDIKKLLDNVIKTANLQQHDEEFEEILKQQAHDDLNELQKSDFMDSQHVKRLQLPNIWKMSHEKRWKLYRYWIYKYRDNTTMILSRKEEQFERLINDYKCERALEDERILRRSTVIAITTTGAARYQDILRRVGPKIILVEEAAEVLEAHIVTTLSSQCEHLILIGDHKQLEPKPAVFELAKKYNLSLSMFERMVRNSLDFHCLQRQHRMRPDISRMIRRIYPTLEDNENVNDYEDIKGVKKNVFFINHKNEENYDDDSRTYSNLFEAEFIAQLCRYLLKQGYERSQITVLTAYSGQMFLIRKHMPRAEFEGVRLSVVDNFQGEENDIIILSLVRNNEKGEVGFLKRENRICVALSRAKKGLYITGNLTMLCSVSELWKKVFTDLEEIGAVGEELPLYCQNHPLADGIMAKYPSDFDKAPDGGCMLPCDFRLPCGHACIYKCHSFDKDHSDYKCEKSCLQECENGHKCQKACHYPDDCCCSIVIQKRLPCGHAAYMKCCGNPSNYKCKKIVSKALECAHNARIPCYMDPDEVECEEIVTVLLPTCKHNASVKCFESKYKLSFECKHIIEKTWQCGHSEKMECHRARMSICKQVVEKTGTCGHIIEAECSASEWSIASLCKKLVEKKLINCSHTKLVPCSKGVGGETCFEMIEVKNPKCGHIANVKCCDDPEKNKLLSYLRSSIYSRRRDNLRNQSTYPECSKLVEVKCVRGHIREVVCGQEKFTSCPEVCNDVLTCGHKCVGKCALCERDGKHLECKATVTKVCAHGHKSKVKCSTSNFICNSKCSDTLACGHRCTGTCKKCVGGTFHQPCKNVCQKHQICGHLCSASCGSCNQCQRECPKFCRHGSCKHPCSETCQPCQKPCAWSCRHLSCTRLCHEICDREPCNKPCFKKLRCGHKCSGFCGEPCPRLCRICDRKDFDKLHADSSSVKSVFLVLLPDCRHEFNSQYLDNYMKKRSDGTIDISFELKCCPKCRKLIAWHPRYGNIIKRQNNIINSVRNKLKESTKSVPLIELQDSFFSYVQKFKWFLDIYPRDPPEIFSLVSNSLSEVNELSCNIELIPNIGEATVQQVSDVNSNMIKISIRWMVFLYLETKNDHMFEIVCDLNTSEIENDSTSHCSLNLEKIVSASDGLFCVAEGNLIFSKKKLTRDDLNMVKQLPCLQPYMKEIEFLDASTVPLISEPDANVHLSDWITCREGHAWSVTVKRKKCPECELQTPKATVIRKETESANSKDENINNMTNKNSTQKQVKRGSGKEKKTTDKNNLRDDNINVSSANDTFAANTDHWQNKQEKQTSSKIQSKEDRSTACIQSIDEDKKYDMVFDNKSTEIVKNVGKEVRPGRKGGGRASRRGGGRKFREDDKVGRHGPGSSEEKTNTYKSAKKSVEQRPENIGNSQNGSVIETNVPRDSLTCNKPVDIKINRDGMETIYKTRGPRGRRRGSRGRGFRDTDRFLVEQKDHKNSFELYSDESANKPKKERTGDLKRGQRSSQIRKDLPNDTHTSNKSSDVPESKEDREEKCSTKRGRGEGGRLGNKPENQDQRNSAGNRQNKSSDVPESKEDREEKCSTKRGRGGRRRGRGRGGNKPENQDQRHSVGNRQKESSNKSPEGRSQTLDEARGKCQIKESA